MLERSLLRLRDLIDRSMSEVRLNAGLVHLQRVSIFDLVQELGIAAAADASLRGVSFRLSPVSMQLEVDADRHLLIGAVQNIVQNGMKFTPRGGHVCLSVHEHDDHVLIEVEDECGGLPEAKMHALFDAFTQAGSDRTGLGLGLAISRASVAMFEGTLSARNIPGKGCVFSIKVPRSAKL